MLPETPLNSAPLPDRDQPALPRAPSLDETALARLRELDPGGGNQLIERIVAAYSKSLERLLPDLAGARGASLQLSVVRHVSHTLKSSSASIGALALAQRCAHIESQVRNGQLEGLEAQLDCMLDEIAQVRQALNALLLSKP